MMVVRGTGIDARPHRAARNASRRKLPDRGHLAQEGRRMRKLKLRPEQLRVESFPVQTLRSEESRMTPGPTLCLPYTCPECPHTRNVLCY
jgi:hypothetical protein